MLCGVDELLILGFDVTQGCTATSRGDPASRVSRYAACQACQLGIPARHLLASPACDYKTSPRETK